MLDAPDEGGAGREAHRQAKVCYLGNASEWQGSRLNLDEYVPWVEVTVDDVPLMDMLHPQC